MLGANPANAATSLLYAGEYFDTDMQQYYLRARWYDQQTGRFNRMDPFAGNNEDPQSLHKYLYCHANPVNGIDPSGRYTLAESLTFIKVLGLAIVLTVMVAPELARYSLAKGAQRIVRGTPPYRSLEICLSFLQDAVGIPGSGVTQIEVNDLKRLLQWDKIQMLPQGAAVAGLNVCGNIYLKVAGQAQNFNRLPAQHNAQGRTQYTISNYPDGFGFIALIEMASTLHHEWQHLRQGAKGGTGESQVYSKKWLATYGKEVQLAATVKNHLQVDTSAIERGHKMFGCDLIIHNSISIR
ncbi:MAG TPA: RHS repeat-associated core domain-containing protein [Sedimentisphaerales bacterium]|nr:RHS repeat-associated core domain-containing protein [Sedimentisphaerales bacterium]